MMDDEEVLEAVHLALRLICEDELARLAQKRAGNDPSQVRLG